LQTNNNIRAKIEQIAVMRVAGSKLHEIASTLGMSVPGVARILGLDEYRAVEAAKLQDLKAKLSPVLDNKAKKVREMYETQDLVPEALKGIVEVAKQAMAKNDLKAALAANKEILDRDPQRTLPRQADVRPSEEPGTGAGLPSDLLNIAAHEGSNISKVN
jgi:hypothetical protein